ncbi:acid phosphatase [Clostridia bacterium]|nr:acid phosphatase [Clostridia bacterium]GHU75307.1 acid phosphatase [Clostridia bacterium]
MTFVQEISKNAPLWTAVLSFFSAQCIKIIIEFFRVKKFDVKLIIGSGGMPSSHASFVTALSTAAGLQEGFDSPVFAVAAVITLVVMYDAAGVRRAAGKQAAVINQMVENIENTGIVLDKKLKELLGHSPVEVCAGAILGIVIGILRG